MPFSTSQSPQATDITSASSSDIALPFLSISFQPDHFTLPLHTSSQTVGTFTRVHRLSLLQCLNDWNIQAPSTPASSAWTAWLLKFTRCLGFVINLAKCDLVLLKQFNFVGIDFDLNDGPARTAQHRFQNLLNSLHDPCSHSWQPGPLQWSKASNYSVTWPHWRSWPDGASSTCAPYSLLSMAAGTSQQTISSFQSSSHQKYFQLTSGRHSLFTFCKQFRSACPLLRLQIFTDASSEGWCAHLESDRTSGVWTTSQKSLHSNNLELLAVHLALQHFQPLAINKSVVMMTDNMTVVGQIENQGGSHSRSLYWQPACLFEWADSLHISLIPCHIPGHLNIVANGVRRPRQIHGPKVWVNVPPKGPCWRHRVCHLGAIVVARAARGRLGVGRI